jgi:hypothetical protein
MLFSDLVVSVRAPAKSALPVSSKQGSLAMSRSSLLSPMPQQNLGRKTPTCERLLQQSDLFYK